MMTAQRKPKPSKRADGWGGGNKTAEEENAERKAWLDSLSDEEYEQLQAQGDAALRRAAKSAEISTRKRA